MKSLDQLLPQFYVVVGRLTGCLEGCAVRINISISIQILGDARKMSIDKGIKGEARRRSTMAEILTSNTQRNRIAGASTLGVRRQTRIIAR